MDSDVAYHFSQPSVSAGNTFPRKTSGKCGFKNVVLLEDKMKSGVQEDYRNFVSEIIEDVKAN